ncbi:[LSU ribosomal protein L11P]-lysine N-methyltransferase [Neobacillus bataviensis]|uniref:[LSU ribosomal protein L11P]-lysine N-methyltransferase n=1 Tax=Neobacillus bataviensis TaxID=220685 RepID=A0A561CZT8_9BACI|nr:50S ribosomal protein L11 methyltransferase [Neobacillus bataviensis]TWD96554.1 [LSU ribosomal protein L11P]-lysine N-methyltransferase [Neobacillus bataviensis]
MYEITVRLPTKKIDRIITHLYQKGYYQTFYEVPLDVVTDANGYAFVEKHNETTELNIYINNYIEAKERRNLLELLAIDESSLVVKEVNERNYQQTFDDIFLENGWVITTPDRRNHYHIEKRIVLDSQGNFGTGYHETTKDCLYFILKHDFSGLSVADIGAGSGVLSVAAALKRAKSIDTYDIQPVEREILYQCELNSVRPVNVFQSDLIKNKNRINKKYDWIFLNIGTQENIDILKAQRLLDCKDTTFILSGMLEWNYHRVETLFKDAGFLLKEKKQSNEWVTCVFKAK